MAVLRIGAVRSRPEDSHGAYIHAEPAVAAQAGIDVHFSQDRGGGADLQTVSRSVLFFSYCLPFSIKYMDFVI